MNQQTTTQDIQQALEILWTDMGALARSPLVEQLGLVEGWPERDRQDAYKRASALIDAILDAAQRLKSNGEEDAFALLDRAYGLGRGRFEVCGAYVAPDELADHERQLDAALVELQSVL
jgi:hypothetical protein